MRDYFRQHSVLYGSYLITEFFHRYTRIWVVNHRTPSDVARDAAFCIWFIGLWREDLNRTEEKLSNEGQANKRQQPLSSLTENCFTAQTCDDIIISCTMVIIAILVFQKQHPGAIFEPSRLSSRFSEYVFQFLRSCTKTSNKVTALQYTQLIKGYMNDLEVQAGEKMPVMQVS